jgi:hypothetical protein
MIYMFFVLVVLAQFWTNSHLPQFSPVFGALLFSGARLKKRDAVWFPVVILAIYDWLQTTQVFHMQWKLGHSITLVAFTAIAGIGGWLREKLTVSRLLWSGASGSAAYFLISNFGVWAVWGIYPHTREGLIACYVAALPYLRSSLLSTLAFGAVLFWGYEWLTRRRCDKQLESAPASIR